LLIFIFTAGFSKGQHFQTIAALKPDGRKAGNACGNISTANEDFFHMHNSGI
jgi:hypothetical protein